MLHIVGCSLRGFAATEPGEPGKLGPVLAPVVPHHALVQRLPIEAQNDCYRAAAPFAACPVNDAERGILFEPLDSGIQRLLIGAHSRSPGDIVPYRSRALLSAAEAP